MPNQKITKRVVDNVAPGEKPAFIWDTEIKGFGLKVTPGGRKIYVLQYRTGGRETPTQRFTIGEHGSPWTAEAARDQARKLLASIYQGTDPRDEARRRKNAAESLAFEDYVNFFINDYLKTNWPRTWSEAQRIIDHDIIPVFRRKPLPDIKKGDIVSLLDAMNDRPGLKRHTYAILKRLFNWACKERDDLTVSPMDNIKAPKPVAKRDRFLTAEELAAFVLAAKEAPYPFGPFFMLAVATLQRREAVASIDWRSVRHNQGFWLQTADETKNAQPHLAPLNEVSLEVLAQLGIQRSGLVFSVTGTTAISGFSRAKAALDARMIAILRNRAAERGEDLSGLPDHDVLPPWRLHDLRRTGASKLQALGVPVEVTEEIIGHKSGTRGGVAGVYNLYRYLSEKEAAMGLWSAYLRKLVTTEFAEEPNEPWAYGEILKKKVVQIGEAER